MPQMLSSSPISIFWFRRDLRLFDNKGLFEALKSGENVIPLFILDTSITDSLPANDARVHFIYNSIANIQHKLNQIKRNLWVYKGRPAAVFQQLAAQYPIVSVYTNQDHEPYGIKRDSEIRKILERLDISFQDYLDHLLFEKDEVVKADGLPYHVFTPYSKRCREILNTDHFLHFPSEDYLQNLTPLKPPSFPTLSDLGFQPSTITFPEIEVKDDIIETYHKTRDYPSRQGTTRLGVHLRFGTISLRQLARKALNKNETFFNELLWREFYAMILWHYPHVVHKAFKPRYDNIEWINSREDFKRWKAGETGYAMVDAGMRELTQTGFMHNRLRMITASFLTKHLLIDWRWGEAWFAEKLLDYELSSNNGGWQWSAGSGCDAAPYFRIFNPMEQLKKFDPRKEYISQWVPEIQTGKYPLPMIDHRMARERCLETYKKSLNE